jgi:hypothetical protein
MYCNLASPTQLESLALSLTGACGWCSWNTEAIDTTWAAHLLPVYDGSSLLPEDIHFCNALDVFHAYFVYPYIDHHSYKFLK